MNEAQTTTARAAVKPLVRFLGYDHDGSTMIEVRTHRHESQAHTYVTRLAQVDGRLHGRCYCVGYTYNERHGKPCVHLRAAKAFVLGVEGARMKVEAQV